MAATDDQSEAEAGEETDGVSPSESGLWRAVHRGEDALLAIALAGVLVVPILEMVLRSFFESGLIGGNAMTQHFTLLVSMLGGAVAAREARLLTLSQGFAKLPAPWGRLCEIWRVGIAVSVTTLLAWASWKFLLFEKEGGKVIAYGVPVWVAQLALVVGFGLVAVRLVRHIGREWWLRGAAVAVVAVVVWYVLVYAPEPETWTPAIVMLVVVGISAVAGAPIFTLLGGAAVFLFWGSWNPLESVALSHYSLSTNPTIPALPLFTLAGYFLAEGGTSHRMVRLLKALTGDLRAGPAIVTVLACAFFTSLTGASGVTILALGGLIVPFLTEARYPERASIGMLTGAGSIGMLFAPCLPLILYAIVAQVEIQAMFLGGVGPGIALASAVVAWATWTRPAQERSVAKWSFDGGEAWAAFWDAKWELLIPVVSLGGIFSGLATPVEAAALTALYALVIETLVYRDLQWGKLVGVMRECGLLIGGVLLILGVAQGLTNYLVDAQVPSLLVDFVTSHVDSKFVFLACLIVILLLLGCMMDVFSAIIIVVPLLVPLGVAYGVDPIHLGVLFLANLGLGFLTPPVGMNLFISSYRFNKPMGEVLKASLPYFGLQFVVVVVITYWPTLTTALPHLIRGDGS
jgi:C4-dicarboxylate transporter, DctM subunit